MAVPVSSICILQLGLYTMSSHALAGPDDSTHKSIRIPDRLGPGGVELLFSPAEVSRDRGPENTTAPPTPPGRERYRLSRLHRIVVRDLEDVAAWSESNSTFARRNSIGQIVNVLMVVPNWYPWFTLTVSAAAIVASRLLVASGRTTTKLEVAART